jgi:DNA modification methylase
VPAIRLDHLNPAQARAFMVADNRVIEKSSWDEPLLAKCLQELSLLDLDFELDATGFTIREIELRIDGPSIESDNDTENIPSASGPPISRPGDLWLLGQHRIFCGNAASHESYNTLLHNQRAAMVVIDPPYNIRINRNVTGHGRRRHREFRMGSGEMDEAEFLSFLANTCSLLARFSDDGALHYIFMDWRHLAVLLAAAKPIYSELVNICVWVKANWGLGSFYRSQHELIAVFKAGEGRYRNNVQLGRNGRSRSNVWNYSSSGPANEEEHLSSLHPTIKPVALVADAILDCTRRGDIVLDSFVGSGTTLIAAERTRRTCYAMELDPLYVDAAIRRWQTHTGDTVRHAITGMTFDEVANEVGRDSRGE